MHTFHSIRISKVLGHREEFQNEFNIADVYDDGCLQYGSLSQSNILDPVGRLLHIFAVCTKVGKFAR